MGFYLPDGDFSPFLEFQNQKKPFIYMPRVFVKLGAYDFEGIMMSSHSIPSLICRALSMEARVRQTFVFCDTGPSPGKCPVSHFVAFGLTLFVFAV